ncbi:MAG: CsbD family protein [Methylococcales bacterium]
MKANNLKLISLSAVFAMAICSFGAYAETEKEQSHKDMNKDQIEGRVGEAQGKAKEETGKILDDKAMEVEGNVQKNLGKTQKGLGDIRKDIKEDK